MSEQYAQQVAKLAIAHYCKSHKVEKIQPSVLSTLSDVLEKYVIQLGRVTKELTELGGRTRPSFVDILTVLTEWEYKSVSMKELAKIASLEPHGFSFDVPEFPVEVANGVKRNSIGCTESAPKYVPSFLPEFPKQHTYRDTGKDAVVRDENLKENRMKMLQQSRSVQHSLSVLLDAQREQTVDKDSSELKKGTKRQNHQFTTDAKPKQARIQVENTDSNLEREEVSKEESMLAGTFYEGDSE